MAYNSGKCIYKKVRYENYFINTCDEIFCTPPGPGKNFKKKQRKKGLKVLKIFNKIYYIINKFK